MTDHITLPRAVVEQALEAIGWVTSYGSERAVMNLAEAEDALRAALAEPVQKITDTERLDWLDTLPCGITIHGDSSFPQSQSATPKTPGASHIRDLIDRNRAQRKNK